MCVDIEHRVSDAARGYRLTHSALQCELFQSAVYFSADPMCCVQMFHTHHRVCPVLEVGEYFVCVSGRSLKSCHKHMNGRVTCPSWVYLKCLFHLVDLCYICPPHSQAHQKQPPIQTFTCLLTSPHSKKLASSYWCSFPSAAW